LGGTCVVALGGTRIAFAETKMQAKRGKVASLVSAIAWCGNLVSAIAWCGNATSGTRSLGGGWFIRAITVILVIGKNELRHKLLHANFGIISKCVEAGWFMSHVDIVISSKGSHRSQVDG